MLTDDLRVCDVDHAFLFADVEHSGRLGPAPAPDPHLPGQYSHSAGNSVVGCFLPIARVCLGWSHAVLTLLWFLVGDVLYVVKVTFRLD